MLNIIEKHEVRMAINDRIKRLEEMQERLPKYPTEGLNWYSEVIKDLKNARKKLK